MSWLLLLLIPPPPSFLCSLAKTTTIYSFSLRTLSHLFIRGNIGPLKERCRRSLLRSPSFLRLLGLRRIKVQAGRTKRRRRRREKKTPPSLSLSLRKQALCSNSTLSISHHCYDFTHQSINRACGRKKQKTTTRLSSSRQFASTSVTWDTRLQLTKQQSTSSVGCAAAAAAAVGREVQVCCFYTSPHAPSPTLHFPADSPSTRTPVKILHIQYNGGTPGSNPLSSLLAPYSRSPLFARSRHRQDPKKNALNPLTTSLPPRLSVLLFLSYCFYRSSLFRRAVFGAGRSPGSRKAGWGTGGWGRCRGAGRAWSA